MSAFTGRTTLLALTLAVPSDTSLALSLIPCRRYQPERVFHPGVQTKPLGLTIPMRGTKKELGDHWRMVETEPKGYNCGT